MPNQHKQVQVQGRRQPSPAQIQTGTGSTYSGTSSVNISSTSAHAGLSEEAEITNAPPVYNAPDISSENKPVTFGHLKTVKVIIGIAIAVLAPILGGSWWVSSLSTKVEHHESIINDVKTKVDKLEKESSSTSAQIQTLSSQASKMEDRMYNEAKSLKSK